MESHHPVSASFKSPTTIAAPEKPSRSDPIKANAENKTTENIRNSETPKGCIGFLDVFLHEARDIHNICIYHKQDVYAKIYLTSDLESTVSTQIINGGGRNPVFNQNVRLNVQTINCCLKCEVWMLSRIKNYLQDQLLGVALLPLSDVVVANGNLVQEFSLSSNDLSHSPAGFVQLSISYTGASPDVVAITPRLETLSVLENDDPIKGRLDKIEFPDLNIVKENEMMVSEYYGIPCTNLDSECSKEMTSADSDKCLDNDNDAGVRFVESFTSASSPDSAGVQKIGSSVSSVSTIETPNEKDEGTEGEVESFVDTTADNACVPPPVIKINFEPEQSVVHQDIVDMYMKSMQQFTESLADMKLPMDIENNNSSSSGNGGPNSDKKLLESKKTGPRVFYGSRAFF